MFHFAGVRNRFRKHFPRSRKDPVCVCAGSTSRKRSSDHRPTAVAQSHLRQAQKKKNRKLGNFDYSFDCEFVHNTPPRSVPPRAIVHISQEDNRCGSLYLSPGTPGNCTKSRDGWSFPFVRRYLTKKIRWAKKNRCNSSRIIFTT